MTLITKDPTEAARYLRTDGAAVRVQPNELRMLAIEARQRAVAASEAAEQRRLREKNEKVATMICAVLGIDVGQVTHEPVEIDGVQFAENHNGDITVSVPCERSMTPCPGRAWSFLSTPWDNDAAREPWLEVIGWLLEKPRCIEHQYGVTRAEKPSGAERLVALVEEIALDAAWRVREQP